MMQTKLSVLLLVITCCFSSISLAASPSGSCPVDHRHMGHGVSNDDPADADNGQTAIQQLAETRCAACHGQQGISIADDIPNLAGQQPLYLCAALEAYRRQLRHAAPMNELAAGLSDVDIINLSEYYAHLHH